MNGTSVTFNMVHNGKGTLKDLWKDGLTKWDFNEDRAGNFQNKFLLIFLRVNSLTYSYMCVRMLNVTKKNRERNGDGIDVFRQTVQKKNYG
jgi:hypothetical protein